MLPLVSPERVSVKVNGVVPLLPSGLTAVAAAIASDVAGGGPDTNCAAVNVPSENWKSSTFLTTSVPSGDPVRVSTIRNDPSCCRVAV